MQTLESYLEYGKYTIIVEGSFGWNQTSFTKISAKNITTLSKQYEYHPISIVLKSKNQAERNLRRQYVVPDNEFKVICNEVYSCCDKSEYILDSSEQTITQTLDSLTQLIMREI
jgi:uncharacterized protein YraI